MASKIETIEAYHQAQTDEDHAICDALREVIDRNLPDADSKIWHAHPVWFLNGNPIVGYGKLKSCMRLLFWSGQSFAAEGLTPEGSFKAAEKRYTALTEFDETELECWLAEARTVQWDYKNLMKRHGRLERLSLP